MKHSDLLAATSILSVILLALHISQDIVFGFDRGGLNRLVGVAILLVLVCGAVLLRERRSGEVIMLLGGVIALAMMPLHMRNGLRPEFLDKSGALLFVWILYLLGVIGAFSVILAIQALRSRRVAARRSGLAAQSASFHRARGSGPSSWLVIATGRSESTTIACAGCLA